MTLDIKELLSTPVTEEQKQNLHEQMDQEARKEYMRLQNEYMTEQFQVSTKDKWKRFFVVTPICLVFFGISVWYM